ncbi:MAG: beta-N-acetylhexosaminidase [Bacteroidetes bacterium]|nr:beta-N-acetylhexosaminidase [Bacteroidota bacterium]MDA0980959.1 beta-N-acetylhexosaminidase [Bacteroidota bacterium]
MFVFLSCSQKSPHSIPTGGIEALIPFPKSVSLIGKVEDGKMFFSGEDIRIQGIEHLGPTSEVVEAWFMGVGVEVRKDFATNANLVFEITGDNTDESYDLIIKNDVIHINANSEVGLFRGFTTLRQMIPNSCEYGGCVSGFFLPEVLVSDSPEFEHRGLLLDCCRHFMEVEFIKKMIDNLALHKMNVLHWHLTEDQGWRIEIDAYPNLTEVGAWRTELDGTKHGGFYSKEEIREIITYASARHVEVIPEIELPGHSQAALAAYPYLGCTGEQLEVANRWGVFKDIYCAGNDSTILFLKQVLTEVCELFPSSRIHIGGDEAPKVRWHSCDKCQNRIAEQGLNDEHELQTWFIEEIGLFLESKGKTIIGWDEILEGGLPDGAVVQSWRGMSGASQAIELGSDVIVSPTSHCYLDYPLSSTDLKKVYSFNPRPETVGDGRVLGGECNMWTEHTPQHLVESMVFPRAIGLSEVLWSGPEFTGASGAYSDFVKRLEPHLERLSILKVDYGMESVPVTLSLAVQSEKLYATLTPSAEYIKGTTHFNGDSVLLGQSIEVESHGTISVSINYRGRQLPRREEFFVDGHAGVFHPIELGFTPSPYYTGGGDFALVDGRIGSLGFHDGVWQAVQGEDVLAIVDLEEIIEIDSIFSNFYRYQDAWIFPPISVEFFASIDGDHYEVISQNDFKDATLKNDAQDIVTVNSGKLMGVHARYVKMRAVNSGLCPNWHAAATEPTWLFCDEIVVREK